MCLWLIDQPKNVPNLYFDVLNQWKNSPFNEIKISYKSSGMVNKVRSRKLVFNQLARWIKKNRPTNIYTGSDRRIEFQYAISEAKKINSCSGIYLDDGMFTYLGREHRSLITVLTETLIKKAAYGVWWKTPKTIGASPWISKIIVAYPSVCHPILRKIESESLQPYYKSNEYLDQFCTQLIELTSSDIGGELRSIDVLITPPHESIIIKNKDYLMAFKKLLQKLESLNLNIGIKYHPRNINKDILGLKSEKKITLINPKIPFEAIIPLLKCDVVIIGDVSTTMLTGRWLKPDAHICAIKSLPDKNEKLAKLFSSLNIETSDITSLNISANKKANS